MVPPAADQDLGLPHGVKISLFSISSRSLPLKLSQQPFSQGDPGSMTSVFTPILPSHARTAVGQYLG